MKWLHYDLTFCHCTKLVGLVTRNHGNSNNHIAEANFIILFIFFFMVVLWGRSLPCLPFDKPRQRLSLFELCLQSSVWGRKHSNLVMKGKQSLHYTCKSLYLLAKKKLLPLSNPIIYLILLSSLTGVITSLIA